AASFAEALPGVNHNGAGWKRSGLGRGGSLSDAHLWSERDCARRTAGCGTPGRRRQFQRFGGDDVAGDRAKLGLLDGSLDQSTLARLKVAAEGLTEESGDSGLDAVLSAIDLRVAVELA